MTRLALTFRVLPHEVLRASAAEMSIDAICLRHAEKRHADRIRSLPKGTMLTFDPTGGL